MTFGALQIALLIGATVSLAGLGVSGWLVSRAQALRERRERRLANVVSPHARLARIEMSAFIAASDVEVRHPKAKFTAIFGFDPEKKALYPINCWVVFAVAGMVAWIARGLTGEFLGALAWLVFPAVWIVICRNYFGWIENRRRTLMLNQFPDALALIVRAIRVGIPVMEAIRIVSRETGAPTAGEFGRLVDQVSIGATLEDSVAELARRSGLPEYRFFATALALQNQTGGTLSDTLENLAEVIRKRAGLKARGIALTSEARASAIILAALPIGTGLVLYLINPPYISVLFTTPSGQKMLGAAAISLTMGLLVIRSIIRRSLPR